MLIYNLWYIFFDCIVIHDQSRRIYDFKVKHTKSIIERKVAPAKCFTRTRCCEITQTCVYVLPANTSNPVDNPMGLPIVCDFVFNVTTWLPPGLRQSSWYICCLRHKQPYIFLTRIFSTPSVILRSWLCRYNWYCYCTFILRNNLQKAQPMQYSPQAMLNPKRRQTLCVEKTTTFRTHYTNTSYNIRTTSYMRSNQGFMKITIGELSAALQNVRKYGILNWIQCKYTLQVTRHVSL